jgi:hypothetical protein
MSWRVVEGTALMDATRGLYSPSKPLSMYPLSSSSSTNFPAAASSETNPFILAMY